MNIHKNARLTVARRLEMVQDVVERKLTLRDPGERNGVSVPTVRKWVGRNFAEGVAALRDASSRPRRSPRALAPARAHAIVELRRRYLTHYAERRRWAAVTALARCRSISGRPDCRPSH